MTTDMKSGPAGVGETRLVTIEHDRAHQRPSGNSPAAYFVDILKFLGDRPKKENLTPLQVLFKRRPDLEHIELTCENTATQLPYVDLTREIMEAAVAPREFKIAEGSDISTVLAALNAQRMPTTFPAIFASKGHSVTDKASVRINKASPRRG